jgi:hypothetical protein
VADTVLADPAEAARLSAVALASRAGVSQASVTRFAQSIGLASHAELRLALAEQKGRSTAPGVAMDVGVQIHPDDSGAAGHQGGRERRRPRHHPDRSTSSTTMPWTSPAGRSPPAQRVDVLRHRQLGERGATSWRPGCSGSGVRVRAWTEVHEALTSAALLTADDVAIAISHSGATSEVVEPCGWPRTAVR